MKFLLFLLCGVVAFAAPVTKKPAPKPAPEATKPGPSQASISAAVKKAVETHVGKFQIGGRVSGVTATVEQVRPMSGWEGKYSVTGKVTITTKDGHGNSKSVRSFSATAETEGNSVKVSDVSV